MIFVSVLALVKASRENYWLLIKNRKWRSLRSPVTTIPRCRQMIGGYLAHLVVAPDVKVARRDVVEDGVAGHDIERVSMDTADLGRSWLQLASAVASPSPRRHVASAIQNVR